MKKWKLSSTDADHWDAGQENPSFAEYLALVKVPLKSSFPVQSDSKPCCFISTLKKLSTSDRQHHEQRLPVGLRGRRHFRGRQQDGRRAARESQDPAPSSGDNFFSRTWKTSFHASADSPWTRRRPPLSIALVDLAAAYILSNLSDRK